MRTLPRVPLALAALLGSALLAALLWPLGEQPLRWHMLGRSWELLSPRALSVLALAPFTLLAALSSLSDMPMGRRLLGAAVRSLLLLSLGVALAEPVEVREDECVGVVMLVDVSESITDAVLERARASVAQAWASRGDARLEVVSFAEQARRVVPASEGVAPRVERHVERGAGTDASGALRLALGLLPSQCEKRVLLMSDGLETEGNLLAETERIAQLGVTLYAMPLDEGPPPEVGIAALEVPGRVEVGEPFTLRAEVFATRAGEARLKLTQNGAPNALDPERTLQLERGKQSIELRSVSHVPGPARYRLQVLPSGPDTFAQNDHFEQTVLVEGSPRVLLVDREPNQLEPLSRALAAGGFDVELRSPAALPTRAGELSAFDFVVLSDTPAAAVSSAAVRALSRFVEAGGGLLVAGGAEAFGLGGYHGTALEELLPVKSETERRRDRPTLAMALVLDKSGSMEGRKLRLAKEAAQATAEVLGPDDYIGVIGFDTRPDRVVRMQSARNRLGVSRDLSRLSAGGGTAIFPALDAAYGDLSATRARIKHVILLTDGQTDEAGLPMLVEAMRADGITVSSIGLGSDVNRSLLTELSRRGSGRTYFTDAPHDIPRLFVRETHEVARSAAVERPVRARSAARASFLDGVPVDQAPPLRGYVATRLRGGGTAQALLRTENGEPLLARERRGLGWSLAWTSDLKPRWAVDWLRWQSMSRFVSQLVRAHMRERPEEELAIETRLQGETLQVAVDALDAQDRFLHGLTGTLRVTETEAQNAPASAALHETAPGRYTARLPLIGLGSYRLAAELRDGERLIARASGSVARPFPAEYAALTADIAHLTALAQASGGSLLELEITSLFAPAREPTKVRTARWPLALWLALALLIIDLWLRRAGGRIFVKPPRRPSDKLAGHL